MAEQASLERHLEVVSFIFKLTFQLQSLPLVLRTIHGSSAIFRQAKNCPVPLLPSWSARERIL